MERGKNAPLLSQVADWHRKEDQIGTLCCHMTTVGFSQILCQPCFPPILGFSAGYCQQGYYWWQLSLTSYLGEYTEVLASGLPSCNYTEASKTSLLHPKPSSTTDSSFGLFCLTALAVAHLKYFARDLSLALRPEREMRLFLSISQAGALLLAKFRMFDLELPAYSCSS